MNKLAVTIASLMVLASAAAASAAMAPNTANLSGSTSGAPLLVLDVVLPGR